MFNLTPVVKQLLIINVLVFLASMLMGTNALALYYPASPNFQPYQIVSHFFMHAGIGHIFFNMFALVMFGSALEALWGPKKFLFFYFFCAIGAAAIHTGYNYFHFSQLQEAIEAFRASPSMATFYDFFDRVQVELIPERVNQIERALNAGNAEQVVGPVADQMTEVVKEQMNIPVVGASGAIYGLLLGFGMLFPNAELMLIFFPVPIKAKYFIPVLMLGELFLGVNRFSWDNIAHFAHLGGALFGLILILYWRKFGDDYRIH